MSTILVTPLSQIATAIRRHRPSHMMTLLSPEHMIETPEGIDAARHLKLGLNDVAEIGLSDSPPGANHVDRIIEFGRSWDAKSPMLVHCWAGVSRSTAAAFILLCDRTEPGFEREIANGLRFRAPHAYPNPLMVRLADKALKRDGRMVAAVESIGRGTIVAEGEIVELPLTPGDL